MTDCFGEVDPLGASYLSFRSSTSTYDSSSSNVWWWEQSKHTLKVATLFEIAALQAYPNIYGLQFDLT